LEVIQEDHLYGRQRWESFGITDNNKGKFLSLLLQQNHYDKKLLRRETLALKSRALWCSQTMRDLWWFAFFSSKKPLTNWHEY